MSEYHDYDGRDSRTDTGRPGHYDLPSRWSVEVSLS